LEAIEKIPPPRDIKGIRSFLGHVGFYRRFIRNFPKIARPLTNFLHKDVTFKFDENFLIALNILKQALLKAPMINRLIGENLLSYFVRQAMNPPVVLCASVMVMN
jgi:hypothetical protein